ncbi:MAG: sulfatase-like hydrolase/transferase [Pseudomonadota bacterium]
MRQVFCAVVVLAAACAPQTQRDAAPTTPAEEARPNIILFLADDLGWNDVSVHGAAMAATPHIDSIGREGVIFRQGYVTSPVCATSRAGLMTGRYQQRFGMEVNPSSPRFAQAAAGLGERGGVFVEVSEERQVPVPQQGLPPDEITLAELLREQGYRTALFGKWHLGAAPGLRPEDQGFDMHVGFYSGGSMFAEPGSDGIVEARLEWSGIDQIIWRALGYSLVRNGEPEASNVYQTDLWADEAVRFIEEAGDEPYFAKVSFNAPHNPLQAPQWAYDELEHIEDHVARTYYAMILSMDAAVGRVLDAVERSGAAERTIIVFSSDNGGADYTRIVEQNAPFRGWKASFWEGGVRVPFLVRAGRGAGGVESEAPVSQMDLFVTLAEAAGAELPSDRAIDGKNIAAAFNGQDIEGHEVLFWRNHHYFAVRRGDWKLHVDRSRDRVWLYDLATDPTEGNNLADTHPQIVEALSALFAAHEAELADTPLWPSNFLLPVFADAGAGEGDPETDEDWINWPG